MTRVAINGFGRIDRNVFDSELTMANDSLVKVFGWSDNECGYSCRLVDLGDRLI
jgi:glyceraldehyde 3-phosphate dehydrogenase